MTEKTTAPAYKRVLLKLSGEAIAGKDKSILDFDIIRIICDDIKNAATWAFR